MKNLIIIIMVFAIMSCTNDDEIEQSSFVLSSQVTLSITDQDGNDLLSPETTGYFPYDDINLYYLHDGEKILVQSFDRQIGGDEGKGMILGTETSPYQLACFTYAHGDEGLISNENGIKTGQSIAFLELSENLTDTIVTEWESEEGKYFVNKKVWYNGELYDAENLIMIIK